MNTKDLIFPGISISVCSYIIGKFGINYCLMTLILGFIGSGVLPIALEHIWDINVSEYFRGKLIIAIAYAVLIAFSWILAENGTLDELMIISPAIALVAEITYALKVGDGWKEKLVLFLSSVIIPYIALLTDVFHEANVNGPWF